MNTSYKSEEKSGNKLVVRAHDSYSARALFIHDSSAEIYEGELAPGIYEWVRGRWLRDDSRLFSFQPYSDCKSA